MKTINGIYQIRDLTIINPTYEVINVSDNIVNKICDIEVLFNTDSIIKYSYTVEGFTYELTWEDSDIETWVDLELQKLKID